MRFRFVKYEGLGNDFVIADVRKGAPALEPSQVVKLCDRHRGVGADGVLLVEAADGGGVAMRVINADGSRPEMCGNGLRCVALYLVHEGQQPAGVDFSVQTDAGPHVCRVAARAAHSAVTVSMRPASLSPSEIPVLGDGALLDDAFDVANAQVRLSCVSMGNPHGVTFDDVGASARGALGPLLEKHARFPQGANIGFARVLGPQRIELAVWERGVGFTQACGTGACACAVAAVETGRAARDVPIEVVLPGGALEILVGAPGERISMTGDASYVFEGALTV